MEVVGNVGKEEQNDISQPIWATHLALHFLFLVYHHPYASFDNSERQGRRSGIAREGKEEDYEDCNDSVHPQSSSSSFSVFLTREFAVYIEIIFWAHQRSNQQISWLTCFPFFRTR